MLTVQHDEGDVSLCSKGLAHRWSPTVWGGARWEEMGSEPPAYCCPGLLKYQGQACGHFSPFVQTLSTYPSATNRHPCLRLGIKCVWLRGPPERNPREMTALALETGSGPLGEGNSRFWDPDHGLEEERGRDRHEVGEIKT